MKVTNKHYESLEDLKSNLEIANLNPSKSLIQIFSGLVLEDEVKQLQQIIKKKNNKIAFIGTTTAGEIYQGKVFEKSISISIIEFKDTEVLSRYFIDESEYQTGVKIASSLCSQQTKAIILFIPGIDINGNDIIDGFSSLNTKVTLAGGMAGDNGYLEKTFIFDQDGVYSKGCVAAALNSDNLNVTTEYELNWQPIGQTMTVTKVEKNRLYEINGMNVSDVYKKYLGENIAQNLPYSATEFPLLKIEDDGTEVCRVFIHKFDEDGSLLTIGNLQVGDKVRLAFGNVDLILNSTNEKIKQYKSFNPEAIFIYSCISRRAFLQSDVEKELATFNKIAPNIGFFTYGEIYHNNNKNFLLNISLTILALSEEDQKHPLVDTATNQENQDQNNLITNKHYLVLTALTHLANTVIEELEEAKQQLKEQANRDYLTGLYNRRYFNDIAQELIYISKRENKAISVVMIDIDKFKNINDSYGHASGDEIIKSLSKILIEHTRKSDIVSRFGGEEFALLLPFTDKNGAAKIARKIRKIVEEKVVTVTNDKELHFTVSLGVDTLQHSDKNIEEVLHRADEALYKAKESGRNRVVIYDE